MDAAADSSTRAFTLPEIAGLSSTYFVSLMLEDASGKGRAGISTGCRRSRRRWIGARRIGIITPTKTFADFTALNGMAEAYLNVEASSQEGMTTVRLRNPQQSVAFGVHLTVKKGADGDEVLPVLWQDNYFALVPGESREITAKYSARDLGKAAAVVEVEGWNVKRRAAAGR